MANQSGKGPPGKPVNDSIDELFDGMPAEPMLPKKRARPIDQTAPSSQNRRANDNVIVREGTDPRERERIEKESARRQSSTFGTSFLGPNATTQKIVVGAAMMILVLGIYVVGRTLTRSVAQNAAHPPVMSTSQANSPPMVPEALPPVPVDVPAANITPTPSSSVIGTTRRSPLHSGHAGPSSPAVQPVPSAHSAGFSGL